MKTLTPKKIFLNEVNLKIKNGDWGYEEILYLEENKIKYHLNYNDIGVFLINNYRYLCELIMADGEINQLELHNLIQFNALLQNNYIPTNKLQRDELKFKIKNILDLTMGNNMSQVNNITLYKENNLNSEQKLNEELTLKEQKILEEKKKKIKSLYYTPFWMRPPKMTPFNS